MAQQVNGYHRVPHATYDEYRNYLLNHGVDVDYYPLGKGNQCWDALALLWYQYGLKLVTRPQGNGSAYMCWTVSRLTNAQPPFISIDGVGNIKRGDILVFNKSSWSSAGHICLADQDYKDRYYYNGAWRLNCVGQNQGQGTRSGTPSNVTGINLSTFLGIFRNTNWTAPSPTPTPVVYNKGKYNFVLFNRRKRQDGQRHIPNQNKRNWLS